MPVLLDGFQEEPVPDALLTPTTRQLRGGHLEDFIHRLPTDKDKYDIVGMHQMIVFLNTQCM